MNLFMFKAPKIKVNVIWQRNIIAFLISYVISMLLFLAIYLIFTNLEI